MKSFLRAIVVVYILFARSLLANIPTHVSVGIFQQEQRIFYNVDDGLPSNDIRDIAATEDGTVFVATAKGLAVFIGDKWSVVEQMEHVDVWMLAAKGNKLAVFGGTEKDQIVAGGKIYLLNRDWLDQTITLPAWVKVPVSRNDLSFRNNIMLGTTDDIILLKRRYGNIYKKSSKGSKFTPNTRPVVLHIPATEIRQMTVTGAGKTYAATDSALLTFSSLQEGWSPVLPRNGQHSWGLHDARGVTVDSFGRLWFASNQGVGYYDEGWQLFTGHDGLPYNDFTMMAPGNNGDMWFGTRKGAVYFDGENWEYRQGKRWLPDDNVRSITVTPNGDAWFATANGVSVIQHRPYPLQKRRNGMKMRLIVIIDGHPMSLFWKYMWKNRVQNATGNSTIAIMMVSGPACMVRLSVLPMQLTVISNQKNVPRRLLML